MDSLIGFLYGSSTLNFIMAYDSHLEYSLRGISFGGHRHRGSSNRTACRWHLSLCFRSIKSNFWISGFELRKDNVINEFRHDPETSAYMATYGPLHRHIQPPKIADVFLIKCLPEIFCFHRWIYLSSCHVSFFHSMMFDLWWRGKGRG
jgi:hypothetical protein